MKISGLFKDSITYGVSSVLQKAISFLLLPLYTQYLRPEEFGIVAMLQILITVARPLGTLGMTNAIFRHFNLEKDGFKQKSILGTGFLSLVFSSTLMLAVGLLIVPFLTFHLINKETHESLVRIALFAAAAATVAQGPYAILRAQRKVRVVALLNIISVASSIGVSIWLVVGCGWGAKGVITATLIADLILCAGGLLYCVGIMRFGFDVEIFKRMISYGLPFMPHGLLCVIMTVAGQYMVKNYLGLHETGLYSIGIKFTIPLAMIVNSVQMAWVPYKFQVHANEKDPANTFRAITAKYLILIMILWLIFSFWAPRLLVMFTAASFHEAKKLVPFLAFYPVIQAFYYMFGTGFELYDDTRIVPAISLSGALTLISMSLFTIPRMGVWGAVLSTISAWTIMSIVVYLISQRRFKVEHDYKKIFVVFISVLLVFVCSVLIGYREGALSLLYDIIFSILAVLFVFWFFIRSSEGKQLLVMTLKKKFPSINTSILR